MRRPGRTRLACAALLLAWAGAARSAAIEVAPVVHELAADRSALTLTVSNRGPAPVTVQLRAFDWTQPEGSDRLDPSPDAMLSPAIFEIAPGASQIVRAWVPAPVEAGRGRAWRLLIDELPVATAEATQAVRVMLRLSVPVFRAAARPLPPGLDTRIDAAGRRLVMSNRGGTWLRLRELGLSPGGGAAVTPQAPPLAYLLPGAERAWPLPDTAALRTGDTVMLSARTDAGRIEVPVVVAH